MGWEGEGTKTGRRDTAGREHIFAACLGYPVGGKMRGNRTPPPLLLVLISCLAFWGTSSVLVEGQLYGMFCPNGESDIFNCMDTLIDANHDGTLTLQEITDALSAVTQEVDLAERFPADMWISGCDFNGDGVLTMADWNHPQRTRNSTCLSEPVYCGIFCFMCTKNGWSPPPATRKLEKDDAQTFAQRAREIDI